MLAQGRGSGGVAGFAKRGVPVHLEDRGSETFLSYPANPEIGSKPAPHVAETERA